MTSSRLETPTNTPGAHRGQRRAPHTSHSAPKKPPARYEPHLDGLFTYCLSVLCDHDAATEALGGVLALAERQGSRCPDDEEERKAWLYALARWTCLRRLTEQKQGRHAHRRPDPARAPHRRPADEDRHAPSAARPARRPGRTAPPAAHPAAPAASQPPQAPEPPGGPAAEAHRRELAQLAWPEAAGTTPEQREALELAVRHGLAPQAVAAVLGLGPAAARELLAGAACEVERTRAALAVVETGNCPTAGRLTGDHRALLSPTLRRELVRHVDDCPRCRRAAERAGAQGPWPGKTVTPAAVLPVVEAPRPSAYVAMLHAQKHQKNRSATPRFDRTGFPMDPKDHAARRDRLRSRVMTTTVVATVVAAPVIALWSAYRGAPLTGEGRDGPAVSAADNGTDGARTPYDEYENAGNARPDGGSRFTGEDSPPEVSAEIISKGAGPSGDPAAPGEGRLTVRTRTAGSATLITLTASKAGPVSWSAATDRSWVSLSRTSGKLPAGRSVTIRALVDHARQPAGPWTAHLTVAPSGAVVALHGYGAKAPIPGTAPRGGGAHPRPPVHPPATRPGPDPSTPDPSTPPPDPGDPTPTPTEPEPSPTPDPAGSSGPPAPPKGPSTPPLAD
ncbi:hypothetical protein FKN01_00560 [Streptomyces sp. 130]|uniref:hypothetical protein n=1 Tax=Streptomyces sp. 130 TaxID=2591006 RepID=UPI00117FC3D1|nr:hypothetical protein [Streptomyces sp. 130]TRV81835.1 hypothetical protein FKN01_00560 [Streptomyces sp. 130]